jgi:hypothetical protein
MRSTFSFLFYLKKSSVKKTGYAPLMVRIMAAFGRSL